MMIILMMQTIEFANQLLHLSKLTQITILILSHLEPEKLLLLLLVATEFCTPVATTIRNRT